MNLRKVQRNIQRSTKTVSLIKNLAADYERINIIAEAFNSNIILLT